MWNMMCTCLIRMCDVTHSDVWHDPYIWWRHRVENAELLITAATFGQRLIHMWDMSHSYVGHDSFICGT